MNRGQSLAKEWHRTSLWQQPGSGSGGNRTRDFLYVVFFKRSASGAELCSTPLAR